MRPAILAVAALALALPTAAVAKGASKATITGPGLAEAIVIVGTEAPGSPLNELAIQTGFYPGVFRPTPDPMLARRPAGKLGPKYRITWTMPGPNNETDLIRQDVYPYATGGIVTYMRPGQRFFTTERTRGGWYRAGASLKDTLSDAGLAPKESSATPAGPSASPVAEAASNRDWTTPVVLAAVTGGLLLLLAAAFLFRGRLRGLGSWQWRRSSRST